MKACILSFNHPQHTTCTAQSVLNHFSPEDVILIHNGSRPNVIDELRANFPAIQHHVMKLNIGFSGGANEALRVGFQQSEWVFFITNDCELLNVPMNIRRPTTTPGIYAPMIYRRNVNKVDSIGGVFYPYLGKLRHLRSLNEAGRHQSLSKTFRYWYKYFYVPGTAFVIHRLAFEKLGGFDERLHTYWEDVDFSVRAIRAGVHLGTAPEWRLLHKVGKTCHKDPFYTNYLFKRNRRAVSMKWAFGLSDFKNSSLE